MCIQKNDKSDFLSQIDRRLEILFLLCNTITCQGLETQQISIPYMDLKFSMQYIFSF